MTTGTALNTATKALLEICSRRGVRANDLLAAANINPALFERYNIRIPADKKRVIWEVAQKRVGDEHLGLRAAEIVPLGGYGILDYLLLATSTLGEALERVSRFYRLINGNAELRLEKHKNFILAELYNSSSTSQRHLGLSAEYSFIMLILRFRLVYGKQFKPDTICFTHSAPPDTSLHQRLFRSPVKFGQAVNRLAFSRDVLNAPLPQSDPELAEMLERQAQYLLRRLPPEENIGEVVREVLRSGLRNGNVSLGVTAKALAMSSRNLQRMLNGQGSSYRKVLDEVRHELASHYLAQQVDVAEITRLLGFTETSAFYRAFKRWKEADS